LHARARTTAAIARAVRARSVPRHAHEKWSVVAVVRRPPGLRIGQQRHHVFFECGEVELLKFFGVRERGAQRIGLDRILMKNLEVELIGPPRPLGHEPDWHVRAFGFAVWDGAFANWHRDIAIRFDHISLRLGGVR